METGLLGSIYSVLIIMLCLVGSDQEMSSPEKKVEKEIDQLERQIALSEVVTSGADVRQIQPAQTGKLSSHSTQLGFSDNHCTAR